MRLFLDLDGVLVDFFRGSLIVHAMPANTTLSTWDFFLDWGLTAEQFWAPFTESFWANLDWTDDGRAILAVCERRFASERIFLLTSPCQTPGCLEGKRKWVQKNLPDYSKRLILAGCKEALAHERAILVDDADHNISAFHKWGGKAIQIPRPWNAARKITLPAAAVVRYWLEYYLDR